MGLGNFLITLAIKCTHSFHFIHSFILALELDEGLTHSSGTCMHFIVLVYLSYIFWGWLNNHFLAVVIRLKHMIFFFFLDENNCRGMHDRERLRFALSLSVVPC